MRQRKAAHTVEGEVEAPQRKPVLQRVAAVDLFSKPKEDYRRDQTSAGGFFSALVVGIIALLLLWETVRYVIGTDAYRTELSLDPGRSDEMDINLDIVFPKVPCHHLSVDVMDVTGQRHSNVTHSVFKTPVTVNGKNAFEGKNLLYEKDIGSADYDPKKDPNSKEFCGECYISPAGKKISEAAPVPQCCNTCASAVQWHLDNGLVKPRKALIRQCMFELSSQNPGCRVSGTIQLRKVQSLIVFGPRHVGTRYNPRDLMLFQATHRIDAFSIGDITAKRFSSRGVHFPLEGHSYISRHFLSRVTYFLKVVPTSYSTRGKSSNVTTYEYSAQYNSRPVSTGFAGGLPGVMMSIDISPIQVDHIFERPPFLQFIVRLCGVVGGLFTILGGVDSLVDRFSRR